MNDNYVSETCMGDKLISLVLNHSWLGNSAALHIALDDHVHYYP